MFQSIGLFDRSEGHAITNTNSKYLRGGRGGYIFRKQTLQTFFFLPILEIFDITCLISKITNPGVHNQQITTTPPYKRHHDTVQCSILYYRID